MGESGIDLDRRDFLSGRLGSQKPVVRPPWSNEAKVALACTGCGACVAPCPVDAITVQHAPAMEAVA